ncbi:MAG TPA: hypothetical protein DER01_22645, partial [Phycisphaerales bacterium]|nr:hypothetical protein [Phycisphaerales bacterium]
MRRKPAEDTGNLDSLLDALTNVVGILIIMLVVALLGMSEAVKRITQAQELDERVKVDHLLDKEKQLEELKELLKQLEPDWLTMEPEVPKNKANLDKLRKQIESLQEKVTVEAQKKDYDVAKLEAEAKQKAQEQQKLQEDLEKAIKRLAELKALLDKTPIPEIPPAEIVRIPNPRDVDKSYKKVVFHIANNRILQEEHQRYREKLERNIAAFERRYRPAPETDEETGGYDFDKFKELIDRSKYGDRNVDVKLKIYTSRIYMDCYLTPKAGDDLDSMDRPNSLYKRKIFAMRRDGKQYGRYVVSADSFAEYVKARNIADEFEIPAGWQIDTNTKDRNWSIYVPVKLKFNKTKPKPKPKSSGGSQPKPKPKP